MNRGPADPARGHALLLRWLRRAQFRAQPGRTLASVAAVAIGVALALAIHLVNASALDSFRHAIATVNGDADAQVRPAQGLLDERLLDIVAGLEGVAVASPILELDILPEPPSTASKATGTELGTDSPGPRDRHTAFRSPARAFAAGGARSLRRGAGHAGSDAASRPMRSLGVFDPDAVFLSDAAQSPPIRNPRWSCATGARKSGCGLRAGCRALQAPSRWRSWTWAPRSGPSARSASSAAST